MISWRITFAWLSLASLGSVSAAGLGGVLTPASAGAEPVAQAAAARHAPLITAHRDADGLFYATLAINGRPVRFLIDTGATHMVLRSRDVAGNVLAGDDLPAASLTTVGGIQAAHWTRLNDVVIEHAPVGSVDAILTDSDLPASLLGQDVLSRLGSLRIDGDELTVGA